jgi:dTDP-4-dehydrorhamnose 3,5-epimerase
MRAAGINPAFAQDSLSRSVRGVVRGMPVRRGDGEAKLVRCWLIPVRRTSSPP